MNNQPTTHNGQQAFALLFAMLIASIMISIGLAIFNITVKEIALSGAGRESQFAFYAADTGLECGLYWDKQNVFPTSTESAHNATGVSCGDVAITSAVNDPSEETLTSGKTVFYLSFEPRPYCAEITVIKTAAGQSISTVIEGRGYNAGYNSVNGRCDLNAPNKLERGIKVSF